MCFKQGPVFGFELQILGHSPPQEYANEVVQGGMVRGGLQVLDGGQLQEVTLEGGWKGQCGQNGRIAEWEYGEDGNMV